MMNVGQLNKRIVLQTLTDTVDSSGSFTQTWADTETVWAAIWPLNGKEYVGNKQIEGQLTCKIRIRYRTGVTIKRRVKYGSRYFDIQDVINLNEANKWLELMCIERFSDA